MPATTNYAHLAIEPGKLSGLPHIAGTRIRVIDIVALLRQGLEPLEMLDSHEFLTLGQIHAALAFCYDHQGEVEEGFRRVEQIADEFRRSHPELCR